MYEVSWEHDTVYAFMCWSVNVHFLPRRQKGAREAEGVQPWKRRSFRIWRLFPALACMNCVTINQDLSSEHVVAVGAGV